MEEKGFVRLIGYQIIHGIKRMAQFWYTPDSSPTEDYQVANKKYVDLAVVSTAIGYSSTFLGCADTPNDYTDDGNKYVKVSDTSNALEFSKHLYTSTNIQVISVSSAFYVGASNVNGSWRFLLDGSNLIYQRRESGNWTTHITYGDIS